MQEAMTKDHVSNFKKIDIKYINMFISFKKLKKKGKSIFLACLFSPFQSQALKPQTQGEERRI